MEEGGGFPAAAADLVKKKDEIERTISEMVQILESVSKYCYSQHSAQRNLHCRQTLTNCRFDSISDGLR